MSKKKKEKLTTPRNTIAIIAKFRNSAGRMKNKQALPIEDGEGYSIHCPDCGNIHYTVLICNYCSAEYFCVCNKTAECSNCLGGASFTEVNKDYE